MQKQTQKSNLECGKSSTGLGRKSLLACAVLAMAVGGNAWADIFIGSDYRPGETQILIESGNNQIDLDADNGTIIVRDQASGAETTFSNGTITTESINLGGRTLDGNSINAINSNTAQVANAHARIDTLGRRIDDVAERSYAGIASVAALAAIPAPAAGKQFSVGVGAGNYSSENAVAVGFRAALTESMSMTAGVSRNTASKTVTNLGVGYSW